VPVTLALIGTLRELTAKRVVPVVVMGQFLGLLDDVAVRVPDAKAKERETS